MPEYAATTSSSSSIDVGKRDAMFYEDSAGTTAGVTYTAPTYNSDDNSAESGDVLTVVGYLLDKETKDPISGATVHINVGGTAGEQVASGTTGNDGAFSLQFNLPSVTSTTSYTYAVIFDGNDLYNGVSVTFTLDVDYRTPNLTLDMPTSAVAGSTVTWSGNLTDPEVTSYGISGKNVYLDESTDGTTWTEGVAGPVTTDDNGAYSGSYTLPTTPGTYYYRSRFPGGSPGVTHPPATSPMVKVRVMSAEEYQREQMMKFALVGALIAGVGGIAYYLYKKR